MISGDQDVVCVIQDRDETVELLIIIIPVDLQVEVTAVDAAECIVTVKAERESVVVICFV